MPEVTWVLISVSHSCTYYILTKYTSHSILDNYIGGAVSFFCVKFNDTNIVVVNLLHYKVYVAKKTKYL